MKETATQKKRRLEKGHSYCRRTKGQRDDERAKEVLNHNKVQKKKASKNN
jgi:hypothetical protein